jgi:hypothetical protein
VSDRHVDPEQVLSGLKDFQRRTSEWAFERLFAPDSTNRFLVADEVGLGKTHVAKGVVAQAIDHLQQVGDRRHDIVYVCSNGAIARQNLRKLVPPGIEPIESVERLTMLPLTRLDYGDRGGSGVNLLAITPGTSLNFGMQTGRFEERCLAYAFLRALWGPDSMNDRARWIFWRGVGEDWGDGGLRQKEEQYRETVMAQLPAFRELLADVDRTRRRRHAPSIRELFDRLVAGLKWRRSFPDELRQPRSELISEVRRALAILGITSLQPDLVILDEFQRFKDLLDPDPDNFAAELAHQLFNYSDPESGRPTKTLLLSATPYRMFSTSEETDANHYEDFLATCSFLFGNDAARVEALRDRFTGLRTALTSVDGFAAAGVWCEEIEADLRSVMSRTERLSQTPDRDGMLCEADAEVSLEPDDLRAYLRFGDLAELVRHHEPTEYWKSAPYLINFMERYKLKEALDEAVSEGRLGPGEKLEAGPGVLDWESVEAYDEVDPQNGRLRWLLDDLHRHRAFELLWMPPSMRYYDTGSVYESDEARSFTKRLIFSGWAVVPKVISVLTSFEAERRAYVQRDQGYTDAYALKGGRRLTFKTERRTSPPGPEESESERRPTAMTAFMLIWPSPTLARLGDPRSLARGRNDVEAVLRAVERRVEQAIAGELERADDSGSPDFRWYWALPMALDRDHHEALLGWDSARNWGPDGQGTGFAAHQDEARAMVDACETAGGCAAVLGRPPDDLVRVLAQLALGGPAQCALRSIAAVTGLSVRDEPSLRSASRVASAFRSFFNAPEVTAIVTLAKAEQAEDAATARYWRDVAQHAIDGNLQAVLDEHVHVLRDWLGYSNLDPSESGEEAALSIAEAVAEALEIRTSGYRVDVPGQGDTDDDVAFEQYRMRSRFAVAFGKQALVEGGEARVETVSTAFNSPFWPFVLASTSVGQEGLDFHLWCHAVVHWNLPSNPVDLEQREGRVHRFKGHAVRRNIAAALGDEALSEGLVEGADPWAALFEAAARPNGHPDRASEIVPYWVFDGGPAKIERHVPFLPYSRDSANLPRLRKLLAAYRLAFGQPRQEELIEFLGADRTDEELLSLTSRLRIDLSPPAVPG